MIDDLIFIDTNILVYAYEEAIGSKNKICFNLIQECLVGKRKLAISNQVISEFINVALNKTSKPLPLERIKKIVKWINDYKNYVKLNYKNSTTEKALEFVNNYNTPYWDALIAATMLENNITTIYTENVKDFEKIKELKVINPLS